ncbi:MAG: aminotransferase class V-fold PLP-dependent enzyme [Holophagales bacterium]|nr:aminotransferase class V-fold PLP-dependent enzyme [Holophagales bacterium]
MDLSRESLDREFPWRLSTIQMNHAAVSPLPARAVAALAEYAQLLSTRGPLAFPEMSARLAALREDAARLLGVTEALGGASSIAIVPNTTYGLALVAQGLDWHPGDVVVTTESEFPANLTPWLDLARYGVEVRRVPTRDGAFTAGEVFAACDARTRLVSLSLVAYHTGFVAPAAEVGAFCRESGIAFGLDAIQAAGAIPVDVAALGADFLSADGHKWMLGPEGCGLFFTTPAFRARLRPPSGWMNLKRTNPAQYDVGDRPEYVEDATKFEIGAPPMPGSTPPRLDRPASGGRERGDRRQDSRGARSPRGRAPPPRLAAGPPPAGGPFRDPLGAAAGRNGPAPRDEAPRVERRRLLGPRGVPQALAALRKRAGGRGPGPRSPRSALSRALGVSERSPGARRRPAGRPGSSPRGR